MKLDLIKEKKNVDTLNVDHSSKPVWQVFISVWNDNYTNLFLKW